MTANHHVGKPRADMPTCPLPQTGESVCAISLLPYFLICPLSHSISDQALRKNAKSNQEACSENAALKDAALNH